MNRQILLFSILVLFVHASKEPSNPQNENPSHEPEDMNNKIRGIAQGIVDKWVAEGLTVTKEKVEGWLDVLDKSQTQGKKEKQNNISETKKRTAKASEQPRKLNNGENFGDDFKQIKDTLVNTFSNIGKAKCENCKKPGDDKKLPQNVKEKKHNLENMSVEELMQKQQAIKQFMEMEKISKLANVAASFSELEKLKDIANLAKTLKTLTPREEL